VHAQQIMQSQEDRPVMFSLTTKITLPLLVWVKSMYSECIWILDQLIFLGTIKWSNTSFMTSPTGYTLKDRLLTFKLLSTILPSYPIWTIICWKSMCCFLFLIYI